jgi:hypothetical protein
VGRLLATQRARSRAPGGQSRAVVLPKRIDTRDKAEFWPAELSVFDEDYWAERSTVPPGDTTPHQAALWRRIFAVQAYYNARQDWAKVHGGNVLDEVIAHGRMKGRLLEQMLRENPDRAA